MTTATTSSGIHYTDLFQIAAFDYIKNGFPVLPLCWPNADGTCGCGRNHQGRDVGKAPLTKHGLKDATQIQPGVKEYWGTWPRANVGIAIPSGYFVLDVDIEHGGFDSLELLQGKIGVLPDTLRITTGSGGLHLWFKTGIPVRNTTALGGFPGIDIRGEGGYVVAPPSMHRSGNRYEVSLDLPIIDAPEPLVTLCTQKNSSQARSLSLEGIIPEGQRNQTLTSLAGTMRRRGMTEAAIEAALQAENKTRCRPPLPEKEVAKISNSVATYIPNFPSGFKPVSGTNKSYINIYERNTDAADTERNKIATKNATEIPKTQQEPFSKRVEDWVKNSGSRWFETPELDRDLGITSATDKNNRREIMLRLREKGIIEQHAKIQKQFRFVNKQLVAIDFKNATSGGLIPIKWPLKIENYVNLFPGNLAVVAGSTNAGKTALLLNIVYLNQFSLAIPIYYFCSEMGDVELKERLELFPGMAIEEWNFKPFDRSTDFADVIAPDCLNIVDYLEMTDDLFQVNTHLTAITKKLGTGLAIVAIQKKVGQKWGRGAEFSAEKSKLYLSMDENKITIVKGKSWANKKVNPNGLRAEFNITGGCEFEMTKEWDKAND